MLQLLTDEHEPWAWVSSPAPGERATVMAWNNYSAFGTRLGETALLRVILQIPCDGQEDTQVDLLLSATTPVGLSLSLQNLLLLAPALNSLSICSPGMSLVVCPLTYNKNHPR